MGGGGPGGEGADGDDEAGEEGEEAFADGAAASKQAVGYVLLCRWLRPGRAPVCVHVCVHVCLCVRACVCPHVLLLHE